MNDLIQLDRFLSLRGLCAPHVLGIAYSSLGGTRLQPLMISRNADGSLAASALEGILIGNTVRRPDPLNPRWIRWDDPRFTDETRAHGIDLVLAQLMSKGNLA